jgi:hypothetical protein
MKSKLQCVLGAWLPCVLLILVSIDAEGATRRSLRIEFLDWTNPVYDLPGPNCPGTEVDSILVVGPKEPDIDLNLFGVTFSGFDDPEFLEGTYCQQTNQFTGSEDEFDYFNQQAFGAEDPDIRALVGENKDNFVKGLRYTFLAVPYDPGEPPSPDDPGFQWVFYTFGTTGITLARLRGLEDYESTSDDGPGPPFISKGGGIFWEWPPDDEYLGEFFCFRDANFLGVWDNAIPAPVMEEEGHLVPDCGEVGPAEARVHVTKAFSDGNTASVDVTLECNDGFVSQDGNATISEGNGHTFVVTDFADGMDCTVSESGGPDGYTSNLPSGCSWTDMAPGDYACDFFNTAINGKFTVSKVWDNIGGPADVVEEITTLQVTCTRDVVSAPGGTFLDPLNVAFVDKEGDFDGVLTIDNSKGSATCTVSEPIVGEGVEASGCDSAVAVTAGSEVGCTITNTVFFEGIPTLSRYGLALMALLMLSMGFIGYRRLV